MAGSVRGRGRDSGTGVARTGFAVVVVVLSRDFAGEGEGALRRKNLLVTAAATVLMMATALVGVVVVALWQLVWPPYWRKLY